MQGMRTKSTNEPARSGFRAKHCIGHEFPVPSHGAHLINLYGLAQFFPVLVYVKGIASSLCVLTQCKYVKCEKFIDKMRHGEYRIMERDATRVLQKEIAANSGHFSGRPILAARRHWPE